MMVFNLEKDLYSSELHELVKAVSQIKLSVNLLESRLKVISHKLEAHERWNKKDKENVD
jgi:uncharacterized membrane protein YjjP (DUF1212 family)